MTLSSDRDGSGPLGAALPGGSGRSGAGSGRRRAALQGSRADFVPPLIRLGMLARLAVPACLMAVTSGMILNGYDSAAGKAMFCLLQSAALAFVLAAFPPSERMWRQVRWPLCAIAAALGWLVLLETGVAGERYAPDLFAPEMLGRLGGVAALLAGFVVAARRGIDRFAIAGLVTLSCLALAAGLLSALADPTAVWMGRGVLRGERFAGLIGNNNVTATVAGVAVLLSVHRFLRLQAAERRPRELYLRLIGYGGAALLAAACQLWTGARFTVAVTAVLAALLFVQHRRGDRPLKGAGRDVVALVVGLAIVAAVFGGVVASRLGDLDRAGAVRQLMWSRYLDAALAAPLSGYGPGAFPTINALFQPDPFDAQATWSAQSAHNVLIQMLLVGGIPYAAALIVAAGLIGRDVVRGWYGRMPAAEQLVVLSALALILASSMIDIALDVPVTIGLFCFLGGTLWGASVRAGIGIGVARAERAPAEKEA